MFGRARERRQIFGHLVLACWSFSRHLLTVTLSNSCCYLHWTEIEAQKSSSTGLRSLHWKGCRPMWSEWEIPILASNSAWGWLALLLSPGCQWHPMISSVAYVLSCGAQDSVALHSRGEHLLNTRYGQSLSSGSLLLGEQWSTAVVIQVIIQVIETIRETETGKLGPKVLTLVVSK